MKMKKKETLGGMTAIAGFLLIFTGHIGLALLGLALAGIGVYFMDGFKQTA